MTNTNAPDMSYEPPTEAKASPEAHPDTPELDELLAQLIWDVEELAAKYRTATEPQQFVGERNELHYKAKAALAKRELEGRIAELFNWEPLYDGDHSKCIDKMSCSGYQNAQSDFENEKELRLAELREELATYE